MINNIAHHRLINTFLLSAATGILSGGACVLFYLCTQFSDGTRIAHPWLLWLLPLAGLLIVLLYDGLMETKDLSAGALFRHVQEGKPVSPWIAPLIALSTCLAYLTGGSVGRTGSALQIGGSISNGIIDPGWSRISGSKSNSDIAALLTACGMASGFTAILGTPLAGAILGSEILVLGRRSIKLIVPTLISSYITWGISLLSHISYTDFSIEASHFADLALSDCLKLAALCLTATLIARFYCYSRRLIAWSMDRYLKNPYLRVLIGTALIILITKLLGDMNCSGIGFDYVAQALNGDCDTFAFFWKLILTCLALGCGIRGGEIAPNIFIGATFGCAAGMILGMDPCLCAAICLISVLSSVTNCTFAIFVYGCEALCLSLPSALCFLAVSVLVHIFSGDIGLFREQPSNQIPLKLHIY